MDDLPRVKHPDKQARFAFATVIHSMAQTRNLCGNFFEDLTAAALHGQRLRTSGACNYCPDVKRGDNVFAESKSSGKNGSVIVYTGRLEKDRVFTCPPDGMGMGERQLFYVVWRHGVNVCADPAPGNVADLRAALAANVRYGVVAHLGAIERACRATAPRLLNSQYSKRGGRLGYGTVEKGYGYGWTIRTDALRGAEGMVQETAGPFVLPDGIVVPAVPVYVLDRFRFLLEAPQ